MAYDGFYSGLSSRQAVSEILTQAQRVRDQIVAEVAAFDPKYDAALAAVADASVVLDQVTVLANQASQDAASASSSAAQAKVSELAAGVSQVAALASEVASKASQVVAKASQDASKASELAAKASELASKASEAAALASQVAAKVSQDASKVSETNSKTSETNSKASEVAAKVSETNSKASETSSTASAASALASKNAAKVSQGAAKVSEDAAKAAALESSASGVQLGMGMWGFRNQPFKGFALDDGQELDRSLYPSFAAALDEGLLPVVSQALWDSVPANRACFVANSSPGKFRMRDLNGVSPGSLGAVFKRGGLGTVLIKQDQLQDHQHHGPAGGGSGGGSQNPSAADQYGLGNDNAGTSYAYSSHLSRWFRSLTSGIFVSGGAGTTLPVAGRVGSETYPVHATGAWMTRLFGVITPLGTAEANSLATAYAALSTRVDSLVGRVSNLEFSFGGETWLTYTNGGTVSASPSTSGLRPTDLRMFARCEVAEHGFSPQDLIDFGPHSVYGTINGASYGHRMENVPGNRVRSIIGDSGIAVISKEAVPKLRVLTPANWRLSLAGKTS